MPKIIAKPTREAMIDTVLDHMHEGLSLRKACIVAGVSAPTFILWVSSDPVLAEQYARAREACIEKVADELLEIADAPVGMTDNGSTDSGAVQKQRLQVDTRRWLLSKLAPKKYGDKITTEVTGKDGGPVQSVTTININGVSPGGTKR